MGAYEYWEVRAEVENVVKAREHDWFVTRDEIYDLLGKYPFLHLERIGKSFMGKEIPALRLGRRRSYVLFAAAFHGTERISAAVCLRFAERLCRAVMQNGEVAGISARRALSDRGLLVVPMVNPDGVDIAIHGEKACPPGGKIKRLCGGDFSHWNANARGVDINHNFDAGWSELHLREEEAGIFGPAPTRYGGSRPMSEAETVALAAFTARMPISHVVALHTQGEVIYWNYGASTPERAKRMARILSASSGYALEEPAGLSSHGGYKDWFIEKYGRPGFTVELGRGKNPLPPTDLDAIYERVEEMLALALVM